MKKGRSNNLGGSGKHSQDTENYLIFKALLEYKQPISRRKLSELTGIEQPPLCRALFNLVHKRKSLEVAQIKPCPKTGKRVYHYFFTKGASNGL